MHGNISVKFIFTIFSTEEQHDTKAGEYHSIAVFNKHTQLSRDEAAVARDNLNALCLHALQGVLANRSHDKRRV